MKVLTRLAVLAMVAVSLAPAAVRGAESPDELYRQGRFEEAEKIYGRLDMDRPRDLRYRYNRGCAAFEKGDDEAALAAFASVLRRAEDEEMRFRAAFNLGNITFRQKDFGTAADWYRRALLFRPGSEDARHNLELALRESEKEKEQEQEQEQAGDEGEGEGKEGEEGKEGDSEGTPSPGEGEEEKNSDSQTEEPDEGSDQAGDDESGRDGENREGEGESKPADPSGEEQDLTGELSPAGEELPPVEESEDREGAVPAIDRKKAEALLDNIREDRARFLRFQVPEDKRHGVESGKDW